jgi:regulator of protease activity HflC (stomatin/prohibitin superfamily)
VLLIVLLILILIVLLILIAAGEARRATSRSGERAGAFRAGPMSDIRGHLP